jgi:nucleotide-binding universal stress UspA family protein
MNTNILLAVDVATVSPLRHVSSAVDMTRALIRDDTDRVIVLHVREFSVARLPRTMFQHGGAPGRRAVDEVVSGLRAAGIRASGVVREADFGHVAQTIVDAAHEFDARVIVLGSRSRTGLPRVPVHDVATHVLHKCSLPVLVVPPCNEPTRSQPCPVASRTY